MSSPHDTITDTKNQLKRFKVSTAILAFLLAIACGQILRDMYLIDLYEEDRQLLKVLFNAKNHDLNECYILLGGTP